MVGTRTPAFKSQSQRLAAHTGTNDSKPSRTPPPAGGAGAGASSGLPGFGPLASGGQRLAGAQKLNTPTKKPGAGGPAQGVTDVYEFPWDDDEQEQAAIAGQLSKPAANSRPAAGLAANRPGAAAAGVGRPKARPVSTVARKLKIPGEQEQPQAPAIQRAGGPLSRINSLDHDTATARSLAGAFPGDAAAGHLAASRGQQQQHTQGGGKQLGIKQFTRVLPPARSSFASGPLPAGMLNHGNTCYLNAILQALLSLPCLAHDLSQFSSSSSTGGGGSSTAAGDTAVVSTRGGRVNSSSSFSQLQLPPDGVTAAMVTCLRQMSACRTPGDLGSSSVAISPKEVREAMRKRASHWGAARQEDAHEFFTALLNALADEVQQAQLEHMQHSSSAARRKQPAAAAAISTAAEAAANGTLELPPSRSSAVQQQHHHHQQQADTGAAAAAAAITPALTDCHHDEDSQQQQQQQQQQQREGSPPAEEPRPPSRQPTPACQLPSMSVSKALCPVTRNFLGCLQHTYTCSVCGKATVQKEQFNHLILDLPQDDDAGSNGADAGGGSSSGRSGLAAGSSSGMLNRAPVADLSSLLANHFNPETCDKACEGCGASAVQHKVEHAMRRLPRVLVVQLKRFKWVISPSGIPDCRKMPTPVQPDKQLFLGRLCVPGRPVPPLLASLMPQRLLRSAMEAAGEQQQQQQHLLLGSGGGGGTAAAAAAVADAGLDGALALEGMPGQQQQQQPDQWQQKTAAKRLAGLRGQGELAAGPFPKKPKFWHSPMAKPRLQQQQRALSPDLPLPGLWGGDSGAAEPPGPPLRRNNSSSAVQRVDLTGLADAADAAAESEYDQQMQLALALSIQEQQQQQQPAGHSSGLAGGEASDDGDVPGLDDSLLPSWMQTDYMPAAAAAPPASPVIDSPDAGSPAAPGPAAAAGGQADADADLPSLTPAAAADGIFALTPPQDASPQQQQQQRADAMDLDRGLAASPVHGLFAGLAPASPVPQAPRQDRSGRVSSSIAPGSSQQLRPAAGQKLGGGLMATGAPSAAAAAAALQRLSASPNPAQPQLLQEVQAAGLSEEEQIKRAIEESMREQQQQTAAAAAAAAKPPAAADAAGGAAAAAGGGAMYVDQHEVVLLRSDVVEDEEAMLKRVLAESAAVYERQQQEQLQLLYQDQQQDAPAAAGGATSASGASAPAAADGQACAGGPDNSSNAGAGKGAAAAAEGGRQPAKPERPPVLLLRLLEDSDYEAEQEELQGGNSSSRDSCRSSSPDAAAAADGAGAAAAAAADGGGGGQEEQPAPSKRRRGRPRKQQQQQQGTDDGSGAAAAGASKRLRSQSVGAPGEAAGAAAVGVGQGIKPLAVEVVDGLEGDKENLPAAATTAAAAAAAGLAAGEAADTDAVPDRAASRGPAARKGGQQKQQKQQKQRRALGEILGAGDSSARNVAAGAAAAAAAAAAAGEPARKPPALAAAVAAAQAAAAGSSAAAAAGGSSGAAAAAAGGGGGEVQELEEGVAAGAVGSWPQDAAASYSLSAVVRHMGDLVSAGHFTSDVLNHKAKRWFHYDDSHVQARGGIETVARLCQRDGYLFFYVNDAISD